MYDPNCHNFVPSEPIPERFRQQFPALIQYMQNTNTPITYETIRNEIPQSIVKLAQEGGNKFQLQIWWESLAQKLKEYQESIFELNFADHCEESDESDGRDRNSRDQL
jgi:hypothetical protein